LKRVTTKVVIDIVTGVVLYRESYLYNGPWALAMDEFEPTAAAFRFYEDGTESGSSPAAAQDTNLGARDVDSDSQVHLRYRVDETGAGAIDGATTDDYSLQSRLNGAGAWTTCTSSSNRVQADTASSLTEGGATTNRATDGISDGAGSFIAGIQKESDCDIIDYQLTTDNFTEHVWALLLVSADFNDADFMDFRITYNGGNPGMPQSVTPRITVTKSAGIGDDEIAMAAQLQTQEPVRELNEIVGY